MKKTLLTLAVVLGTLSLIAQQPERQVLHNQFSDYVGFRKNQELKFEKPQIEKKDGKVIVTMSEEQFIRMNQMRMGQRFGNQLQQGQPPISIKIDSLVPAPKYLLLEEQIKRLKKIDATYGSAYVEKIESIYKNVDRKTLGYRCYVDMEEMYEGKKMRYNWVYILDENFNVF